MTNRKTTRRALVLSLLALLLCCSMLVGTTFAWFTDSVTSGNNRIVAGNLDVDLVTADGNSVQNVETLFDDVTLWEPGAVAWESFTVKNLGTLALKYELNVVFDNENTVIEANGEDTGLGLSDILQVALIEGGVQGTTREQVLAEAAETEISMKLAEFAVGGELLPAATETYGVVIWWAPGEEDNNWNVNNGKSTSDGKELHIGLDVLLNATQKMYEDDSFGPDYDAGLETTYVSTYEELVAALNEGGKVVLENGIVVPAGETPVIPVGVKVVLDLNGKKLSHENVTGEYALNNHGTLVLRDSVGGGSVESRGMYNGYNANGEAVATATLIVENGNYNAKGENGGAAIFNYGVVEIKSGKFTSVGGYSLNNQGTGVMTIANAEVTGGIYNVGGLTVNSGKIATNRGGYTHAVYHAGTNLIVNGGEFSGNGNEVINANSAPATINGGSFEKVEKTSYLMAGSKMVINGGVFNAHESNPAGHPVRPDVIVKGGTFNYKHTNIAAGYTIQDNGNGTWTVVSESYSTVVADGLYKAADANEYAVANGNGLAALNAMMADKTAGKNVVVNLIADIDMTGKTWTPVDSHADSAFTFAGLNGNGHTISNLTVNGQAMFRRFAGTGDVVIKDVTFDKTTINSTTLNTSILTVQTYQNVLLDNVDVKNSTITGAYKVAPLIATVYNESESTITATLKNCDVENVVVTATSYDFCTTGMVAFVYADDNDKVVFENCTVSDVELYAPNAYTAHAWVYTTGSETLFNEVEGVTVTNCTFENK